MNSRRGSGTAVKRVARGGYAGPVRAVLRYTAARAGLFAVALGLLYLLGARSLLLIGLALLVSGLASYVLLSRQRDELSSVIDGKFRGLRGRLDAGAASEDTADDQRRG